MNYLLHLVIMFGLYLLVAYSLNLVVGYAGLLSLCHAANYGIGAYSYALLAMHWHAPFWVALPAAGLITAAVAMATAALSLRFRGDLFVFVTLSWQMIVFAVLYNWIGFTNGPYGITGIPRPAVLGAAARPWGFAGLVIAANILLLPLLFALYRSPFGLTLKALRENERAAAALGIPPFRRYLEAMVIAAAGAAVPGALYAAYVTYIDPTSFTLDESIFQISILLLGGSGNRIGPLLGVTVMVLLPEALRFLGLPEALAPNVREGIYGLVLIVLMLARPQGIAGEFELR